MRIHGQPALYRLSVIPSLSCDSFIIQASTISDVPNSHGRMLLRKYWWDEDVQALIDELNAIYRRISAEQLYEQKEISQELRATKEAAFQARMTVGRHALVSSYSLTTYSHSMQRSALNGYSGWSWDESTNSTKSEASAFPSKLLPAIIQ